MNALDRINATIDPQASEPYESLAPADAVHYAPSADSVCWETHSGTHYPSLDSVPWQAQGSAVQAECDGFGPAHS